MGNIKRKNKTHQKKYKKKGKRKKKKTDISEVNARAGRAFIDKLAS